MKDKLKKLTDLENQRREVIHQITKEFNEALKQVFVDNSKLESINMSVNNHEFNDGDATSVNIGPTTGTTIVKNDLQVDGGDLTFGSSTTTRPWSSPIKSWRARTCIVAPIPV